MAVAPALLTAHPQHIELADEIVEDDGAVAGHGGLSSHSGAIPGNRLDTAPRGGVAVTVNLKAAPVVAGLPALFRSARVALSG